MESTPDDPCLSASYLVLHTCELLELILSYVPPARLLLLQRTSHHFHQLTTTSPLLQKVLFMAPDWTLAGLHTRSAIRARPLNNLMLHRITGTAAPTMTLSLLTFPDAASYESARRRVLCRPHPRSDRPAAQPRSVIQLGRDLDDDDDGNADEEEKDTQRGLWTWSVNVCLPASSSLAVRNPAADYPEASWRRMLLSQPPPTELHLCRRWMRAESPVVEIEGGITMGDLIGAAEGGRGKWNHRYVCSDEDWHLEGPVRYSHFIDNDDWGVRSKHEV